MKIDIVSAMFLVTTALGAVVARDIPPGPDLEVDDFVISKQESVMDYGNYSAKQDIQRMGSPCLKNVQCKSNGQYMPHPDGCSKFVRCSHDIPIEHPCSPGTVWSQSELTCVHLPYPNCGQIAPVTPSSTVDCSCGMTNPNNRIIGGVLVDPPRKYPWQVGLIGKDGQDSSIFCGGSIINTKFILTAAHCVYDSYDNPNENLHVQIGEQDQTDGSDDYLNGVLTVFRVKYITIHPCYNCKNTEHDFALLELNDPIDFSDGIRPVCLPDDDTNSYAGYSATIAGWGDTKPFGYGSQELMELGVDVLDNNNCGTWDPKIITSNMLCAQESKAGDKNACDGDSGGPLVVEDPKGSSRYVQVGLASFVGSIRDDTCTTKKACNLPDTPGIYARVSKVLDWIKAKSAPGQYCNK